MGYWILYDCINMDDIKDARSIELYLKNNKNNQFASWILIDENTVIKIGDHSFFTRNGSSVASGIKFFFEAEDLVHGDKKKMTLRYRLKDYRGRIYIDPRLLCQIFWCKDLSDQFNKHYHGNTYPYIVFKKIGNLHYEVSFVDRVSNCNKSESYLNHNDVKKIEKCDDRWESNGLFSPDEVDEQLIEPEKKSKVSTIRLIDWATDINNPKLSETSYHSDSIKDSVYDEEKNDKITSILSKYYKYGFKYDSIRELLRFRQFAEAMNITLTEDDEILKNDIISSGTIIDNKVYLKRDEMVIDLQNIVDRIHSSGTSVIYYESLFDIKHEWMKTHIITSPDMLKEYLQRNISNWSFSKKFMIKGQKRTEKEAVTDEIMRVWGDELSQSVYALHDKLPYVPLNNIWRVISGNNLFVLVSEGEYLFTDRFHISEAEEETILKYVSNKCDTSGFASLNDIPLGDIEEENYELDKLVIYNAIFKKILSGKYYLNEKILTRDKQGLGVTELLKQYISNKDKCTFREVEKKVVELTGVPNRDYAFQALYDEMVRIDKNVFVSDKDVEFDVNSIDDVLSSFIIGGLCAIRDVTTFAMFPICGQGWNYYLLESFCYRYSKKYCLRVIHFNDKNAGIIAEKGLDKNYNEMLAIALARSDKEINYETSGQYLFDSGYLAKRKYAGLNDIMKMALMIRRER